MEAMGYMIPCVEACASYKGEVLYDDWIQVKVWVSEVKRASLKFEYEVVNESTGKLCTTGHTWHVLVGSERKAVTMPPQIPEILPGTPAIVNRCPETKRGGALSAPPLSHPFAEN